MTSWRESYDEIHGREQGDPIVGLRDLSYDVPADGYDELYGGEQLEKYELAFRELRSLMGGLRTVLDVGCGTGLLGEYLEERGYMLAYVGVDEALDRLMEAKRKSESWMLIQADAQNLPIRSKSMDLTACITVIHLLNPRQTIGEILRATRKAAIISLLKKRLDLRSKLLEVFYEKFRSWRIWSISNPEVKDEIFLLVKRS